MTILDAPTMPFPEHLRHSYGGLRSAMADLLLSINAPAERPLAMARMLGVNKNLAWKACRLIETHDPAAGCDHIPGSAGLDLLLDACAAAGADQKQIDAVKEARRRFDRMQELHAGDRHTFDLMLDSVADGWNTERLEKSRRLAFQGGSGIWGIQARVRVTTQIIAPNHDDAARLDFALAGGYVDCRRIRPNVRWPLFQLQATHDDGTSMRSFPLLRPRHVASGASATEVDEDKLILLDDFCTDNLPEIITRQRGDDIVFELGENPVGKTGAFTCFFCDIHRAVASRYRTEKDQTGRVASSVLVPAEALQFDLLIHRDFVDPAMVEAHVYGMLPGAEDMTAPRHPEDILPIPDEPTLLARGLPDITTPLVPRYRELVDAMFERGGWNKGDFVGVRLSVKYPPLPSAAVMEFPLQAQP